MTIFTSEHNLFKETVRQFCEKELIPHIRLWEEKKYFPSDIFKTLGKEGYLGIFMDEAWGGVALDYTYAAAWCEEFGRVPSLGFTTGVNMHSLVIAPTLQRFGSQEEKEKWLSRCVEGTAIGAYAFTEPGAGSDLSQIRTKAIKDGDDYVIEGSKIFITNGHRANFVLVLAKTDSQAGYKGFTTFVVDTSLPGFSVSRNLDKLGWHCSDTSELSFDGVRVPKTAILGSLGAGWKQAMSSLEWERVMLSLLSIAGASKCLEDTCTYVSERKVFGKYVGEYRSNQEALLRFYAVLDVARSLAYHCVQSIQDGKPCRLEVCALKKYICEYAFKIADFCLQLHGGYGYTTEFLPERWLRDLRLNSIGGGTTQIMERVMMKEIWK